MVHMQSMRAKEICALVLFKSVVHFAVRVSYLNNYAIRIYFIGFHNFFALLALRNFSQTRTYYYLYLFKIQLELSFWSVVENLNIQLQIITLIRKCYPFELLIL